MSAQLAGASASFTYNGASIALTCGTADELRKALASFGIGTAANDAKAATPASTGKPKVEYQQPDGSVTPTKRPETGNAAPASTPAPAGAPAAASGSAPAGEAKTPDYNDVRDRVLKLAKISRETAQVALAKFGVDHGNKLKLEDYPAFIEHADELLKVTA